MYIYIVILCYIDQFIYLFNVYIYVHIYNIIYIYYMCMYVCSCRIIRILLTTSAHGCLDRTSCIMVRRSSSKRPACISTDHTSCDTLHLKQASIDEQSSSTGSPMKTSFIFQENNGLTSCPVVGMNCRRHFWTPSDKPILQRYKKL